MCPYALLLLILKTIQGRYCHHLQPIGKGRHRDERCFIQLYKALTAECTHARSTGKCVRCRPLFSNTGTPIPHWFRLTSNLKANKSHTLTMSTLQLATQSSITVPRSWNGSAPGPLSYSVPNWMDSGTTISSCFEGWYAVPMRQFFHLPHFPPLQP